MRTSFKEGFALLCFRRTYAKARHLNAEFLDALKGKAVRCLDTFTCQSLSLLLW